MRMRSIFVVISVALLVILLLLGMREVSLRDVVSRQDSVGAEPSRRILSSDPPSIAGAITEDQRLPSQESPLRVTTVRQLLRVNLLGMTADFQPGELRLIRLDQEARDFLRREGTYVPSSSNIESVMRPVLQKQVELDFPIEWDDIAVTVDIPGFCRSVRTMRATPRMTQVDLSLVEGRAVTCVVLDQDGNPLPDTEVRLRLAEADGTNPVGGGSEIDSILFAQQSICNAHGIAVFSNPIPAQSRLHAIPVGRHAESIQWNVLPGSSHTLICGRPCVVSGRVRSREGAPISDVNVALYSISQAGSEVPLAAVKTDSEGRYSLERVPTDVLALKSFAEKRGWSLQSQYIGNPQDSDHFDVDFTLFPAHSVTLLLRDSDGSPLADQTLRVVGMSDAMVPFRHRTDATGRVEVGPYLRAETSYQVQLILDRIVHIVGEFQTPSDSTAWPETVELTLSDVGRVRFIPIAGFPIEGVQLLRIGGPREQIIEWSALPEKQILPWGHYTLVVYGPEGTIVQEFVLPKGGDMDVAVERVRIPATFIVSPDAEGVFPVIQVFTITNVLVDEWMPPTSLCVHEVPVGMHYCSLVYRNRVIDSLPIAFTEPDQRVDLGGLYNRAQGFIRGRVVDQYGRGVAGQSVLIESDDGYRVPRLETDVNGWFEAKPVSWGEYEVSLQTSWAVGDGESCLRMRTLLGQDSPEGSDLIFTVPDEWNKVSLASVPGRIVGVVAELGPMLIDLPVLPGQYVMAPSVQPDIHLIVAAEGDGQVSIYSIDMRPQGAPSYSGAQSMPQKRLAIRCDQPGSTSIYTVALRLGQSTLGIWSINSSQSSMDVYHDYVSGLYLEVRLGGREKIYIDLSQAGDLVLSPDLFERAHRPVMVRTVGNDGSLSADLLLLCCRSRYAVRHGDHIITTCSRRLHVGQVIGEGLVQGPVEVEEGGTLILQPLSGEVQIQTASH